jgi:hypothetical protein
VSSEAAAAQRPGEKTGLEGLRGEGCLEGLEDAAEGARWLRSVDLIASSCSTISAAKLRERNGGGGDWGGGEV